MKTKIYSTLILFLLFIYSCDEKFELQTKIKKWEKKETNSKIIKIDITEKLEPFYFRDSANLLNENLKKFISHKKHQLSQQQEDIKKRIERLEKHLDTSENSIINKIIIEKINALKEETEKILFIADLYKNHTEKTQIQVYQNSINKYLSNPDSLIGFTLKSTFLKNADKTLKQKNYFFDKDKKIIHSY